MQYFVDDRKDRILCYAFYSLLTRVSMIITFKIFRNSKMVAAKVMKIITLTYTSTLKRYKCTLLFVGLNGLQAKRQI